MCGSRPRSSRLESTSTRARTSPAAKPATRARPGPAKAWSRHHSARKTTAGTSTTRKKKGTIEAVRILPRGKRARWPPATVAMTPTAAASATPDESSASWASAESSAPARTEATKRTRPTVSSTPGPNSHRASALAATTRMPPSSRKNEAATPAAMSASVTTGRRSSVTVSLMGSTAADQLGRSAAERGRGGLRRDREANRRVHRRLGEAAANEHPERDGLVGLDRRAPGGRQPPHERSGLPAFKNSAPDLPNAPLVPAEPASVQPVENAKPDLGQVRRTVTVFFVMTG